MGKKFARDELLKFIKFGVTGVSNTAVDFAVFFLLSHFGVGKYLAQTISYSCGMLNSYIINRSWTFKSGGRFWGNQMIRFMAANITLLLLSIALLWGFTAQLGFSKLVAKLFATAIIMVAGFIINRLWVFKGGSAEK